MPQAIGRYFGKRPNPHILYGQDDIETAPTTFNRIGTRWGDVQLSNGWQNTDYGRRTGYAAKGYLIAVLPSLPGQTRLSGSNPADFPARGPAPSQWQFHVNSSAGSQPSYPGGPGYIMGQMGSAASGSAGG